MTRICPTEHQECVAFVQWANLQKRIGPNLIHIPNEGVRSVKGHVSQKRAGLKSGASDYFLAVPTDHYHGLFLEMKRKYKSKTSQEQLSFIEQMKCMGYYGDVCYGFEQARALTLKYLDNWKF